MLSENKNSTLNRNVSISPITEDFLTDNFCPDADTEALLSAVMEEVSKQFRVGTIVSAEVLSKDNSGITVTIGYKSDGYIPASEFTNTEYGLLVQGSTVEVFLELLEDLDGKVVLSYQKAKLAKAWASVGEIFEKGLSVTGKVTQKVKGGLNVDIGIPAFLPGSQLDLHRVTSFDQFIGQDVTCKIIKLNRKRGNAILSRRKYLEETREAGKAETLAGLVEGQIITGVVKNITNYGAFVDIGGIDGLLHITDMSWGRIAHPSEVLKIGDSVTVKIVSFDREREKISLGMKQLTDNPWIAVEERYPVGTRVKGKVASIADYGLFVEIERGIEGLVHISEISWTERVHNLSKKFTVGDSVEVVVSGLDRENRRMSLSIKRLEEDPWQTVFEKINVGDKIRGKITNIADFGIFVQICPGADGLVHISDISWTEHVIHPSEKFKKDELIDVCVLAIDRESRKISLGIKQLEKDPWVTIEEDFPVGSKIEGVATKVTKFGVFVKLKNGLEGLAHISELGEMGSNTQEIQQNLKVGQKLSLWVVRVSQQERRLGLSLLSPDQRLTMQAGAQHSDRQHAGAQASHSTQRSHQPNFERNKPSAESSSSASSSGSSAGSSSSSSTIRSSGQQSKSAMQLALEKRMEEMGAAKDNSNKQ